jgi:hypothetical protein
MFNTVCGKKIWFKQMLLAFIANQADAIVDCFCISRIGCIFI